MNAVFFKGEIHMPSSNFSRFFNPDLSEFSSFSGFGFNFNALLETHRKNLEALSQAHQMAFEGMQAMAQRHREMVSSIVHDNSSLANKIIGESTPEQKVARQADLIRKNYENGVRGLRELADMMNESNAQASDILNRRVSASFTEMKSVIEKSGKASATARQRAAA
jgi:phasin family protein